MQRVIYILPTQLQLLYLQTENSRHWESKSSDKSIREFIQEQENKAQTIWSLMWTSLQHTKSRSEPYATYSSS